MIITPPTLRTSRPSLCIVINSNGYVGYMCNDIDVAPKYCRRLLLQIEDKKGTLTGKEKEL